MVTPAKQLMLPPEAVEGHAAAACGGGGGSGPAAAEASWRIAPQWARERVKASYTAGQRLPQTGPARSTAAEHAAGVHAAWR